MPSGAGQVVTRRERTAASIRRTTDAASSSAATRPAARVIPCTPRLPITPARRRSTSARSPTDRHAVAATIATACRSPMAPAVSAVMVWGISCTNARDNPTNRSPRDGDSRRASATWEPSERAESCGRTCSWERRSASVARACTAPCGQRGTAALRACSAAGEVHGDREHGEPDEHLEHLPRPSRRQQAVGPARPETQPHEPQHAGDAGPGAEPPAPWGPCVAAMPPSRSTVSR